MNNIKKEANVLKRALRNDITLKNLERYARKIDFTICFFNDNGHGDRKLKNIGCEDKISNRRSFCFVSKYDRFIFVDGKCSENEKIKLVLHEIGHIVLKHMEDSEKDSISTEIEADAFVYEVLYCPNKKTFLINILSAALILTLLLTDAMLILKVTDTNTTVLQHSQNSVSDIPAKSANPDEAAKYYVTPQGNKYHKADCRYVKNNKECTILTGDELAGYEPCSVCIK